MIDARSGAAVVASWLALALLGGAGPVRATDAREIADPPLRLDTGSEDATVHLTELGPGPYIVAPIFTSCRAVCSTVARSLKSAWGDRGPVGTQASVLLVSFDPQDTRADMAHFRELFGLPASWRLATLGREEGLRLFSELGFRWRTLSERQFDHSGKVFVLTDRLQIAAVLGPDQLTTERLVAEVESASSGASLWRRAGTHWVGFFGVGSLLLLLVVFVTWDKLRTRVPAAAAH